MDPQLNAEGEVKNLWVKKLTSSREWDGHYAKNAAYKLLEKTKNGVLVAFRHPLYNNQPLPHHLEACSDYEIKKLNPPENAPR